MDQYSDLLKLSETYRIILVANALISTILYPYLLYLFFYRTPKEILTCMKINMFNASTTCYALVVVLALWQPVSVLPLLANFSFGPLRLIGDWITIYAYEVTVSLALNLIQTYTMAHLLYYSALKPSSRIAKWMGSYRKTAICYAIQLLLVWSLTITSIHYTHNSPEELGEMIDDMPSSQLQAFVMEVAQHEPSFSSYSRDKLTKGWSVIYIVFLASIIVGELIVITLMTYKTAKEIQLTKKTVQLSTHKAQMMVFRMFVLNSIFFLLFFLAPLAVVLLSLSGACQSHWPSFVMYTLWSLHTPILFIKFLLVMRPYRRFTCALLIRTFSFIRCVKCKRDSKGVLPDQSSDQMSHTRNSTAVTTMTGSEKISERNSRVHPISSEKREKKEGIVENARRSEMKSANQDII